LDVTSAPGLAGRHEGTDDKSRKPKRGQLRALPLSVGNSLRPPKADM